MIKQLSDHREVVVHGERPRYTFNQAAAYYVTQSEGKVSLETEIHLLNSVMPFIGEMELSEIHNDTLKPYVEHREKQGRKNKTINLALGVVRHILNLAADTWVDENKKSWLDRAPKIKLLPLAGFQRPAMPITWSEQVDLLEALPTHLKPMALFMLNTGCRDDVVCSLRWDWEIKIPELGISVFEVPSEHVKGRKLSRIVVCNTVAHCVIEEQRGKHKTNVFVYRRERVKNFEDKPLMKYKPIQKMNNTAWQTARTSADLGDLHVHDLRHTVGMRLREAKVSERTIADILWHSTATMTQHYSVAQIVELFDSLEKIKEDSGQWNKSLATLKREQQTALKKQKIAFTNPSPPKVPQLRLA